MVVSPDSSNLHPAAPVQQRDGLRPQEPCQGVNEEVKMIENYEGQEELAQRYRKEEEMSPACRQGSAKLALLLTCRRHR